MLTRAERSQFEIYPGSKLRHFRSIQKKTGIPYEEMVGVAYMGYLGASLTTDCSSSLMTSRGTRRSSS